MQNDKLKWKIFWVTGVANFASAFSVNSMNLALPTFAEIYDVSQSAVSWLTLVYSLLPCCMLLFFGGLGDILGNKRQFMLGFFLFALASMMTPVFAVGLGSLIFFRCFQAVGYSMITSITQAIVSRAFPAEERGKALGVNTVFVSIGLASGPTIGGILLTYFGWQAIFYFCVPFCAMGAVAAYRVLPADENGVVVDRMAAGKMFTMDCEATDGALMDKVMLANGVRPMDLRKSLDGERSVDNVLPADRKVKRETSIDYVGALLFAGAAGSFATALNFVDDIGLNVYILMAMAASAILLCIFISWEKRVKAPIMPLSLFKYRTFTIANIASVISYMVQQMINFLVPFYLVSFLMIPSDKSGLVMLAMPMAMMISSPIGGQLADKKGFRFSAVIGLSMLFLSCVALGFLPEKDGGLMMFVLLVAIGTANGFSVAAINSGIFSGVPANHLGVGSGMVATMRNLGQTLGVAYGSVMISLRELAYVGKGMEGQLAYLMGQRDTFFVASGLVILAIILLMSLPKNIN